MKFIWDEEKNILNKAKHGVDFQTAAHIFADPFLLERFDGKHSDYQDRWQLIGSVLDTVLFVVETELSADTIRIISARKAAKSEQEEYYAKRNLFS